MQHDPAYEKLVEILAAFQQKTAEHIAQQKGQVSA